MGCEEKELTIRLYCQEYHSSRGHYNFNYCRRVKCIGVLDGEDNFETSVENHRKPLLLRSTLRKVPMKLLVWIGA